MCVEMLQTICSMVRVCCRFWFVFVAVFGSCLLPLFGCVCCRCLTVFVDNFLFVFVAVFGLCLLQFLACVRRRFLVGFGSCWLPFFVRVCCLFLAVFVAGF